MMKEVLTGILLILILACQPEREKTADHNMIRFEKISYFKSDTTTKPFQFRLTYYFDNGKAHRWLLLDSIGHVLTDYIYEYDQNWKHIGARYREDRVKAYSVEKVRFENDRTQITEWLDTTGVAYYTMTDLLNENGKTIRAEFAGDQVHGFDTTIYTKEGFVRRVYFTSVKGSILNDRSFEYDSLNENGDWVLRRKIMQDTVREIHRREVYYDNRFTSENGLFYEGVLSTGEMDENVFSFTKDEDLIFQTRTVEWDHQFGFTSSKIAGLYAESLPFAETDSIYNGAISPSGEKLIYSTKENGLEEVILLQKVNGRWSERINLTQQSHIKGGYFYWHNENELYFYIPENNGNIVRGVLDQNELVITDQLQNLNTPGATEFSPYVHRDKRWIIFTRYLEGDVSQQGFFISYNLADGDEPVWSSPKKLTMLPYGWNAWVLASKDQFLYTNGEDIMSVPLNHLNIEAE